MNPDTNAGCDADNRDIVSRASEFASNLLRTALPETLLYHDIVHTQDVVAAARTIGFGSMLDAEAIEIVTVAAWFHDTGYVEVYKGHEEKGVVIARAFLDANGYPEQKVDRVAGCILATRVPQRPQSLAEQVICDADLAHLGTENFPRRNELLRHELAAYFGKIINEAEWIRQTIEFMNHNLFHTPYALAELGGQREENIRRLHERYSRLEAGPAVGPQ